MITLERNWKCLKELFWETNNSKQVFIDDSENIIVVESETRKLDVIAYAHVTGNYLFSSGLIDFIKDIKSLCERKGWNNYVLKFTANVPLRKMRYSSLLKMFPTDVEYYFFDTIDHDTITPIREDLQKEIESLVRMEKVKRNYDYTNEERQIMNDIKDGYGDLHGL